MNKIGIYQIRNLINGKIYIGSSVHIYRRWGEHRHCLRKNYHNNPHLQFAWNKYGERNFIFEILELVDNYKDLIKIEQRYLNVLKPDYNIAKQACSSSLGTKRSEEVRKNMSEVRIFLELAKGSNNPKAKINEDEVREIRKMWKTKKYKLRELGDMWGIQLAAVWKIVKYKTWKHVE